MLRTPPYRRVTLGRHGFIFLNSADDEHLYGLLESECVYDRTPERFDSLKNSLGLMAAFARDRGLPIDVVIIPTLTTLYGDYLPSSVPEKYRIACAEHAAGRTPLLHIEAPAPVHFVYPFPAMRAARGDDAFFPKGNFHPTGLSLKVARDTYLVSLGASGRLDDILELGVAPSEVLLFHGRVYKYLPVYKLHNPYVRFDEDTNAAIRRALSPLFDVGLVETQAYTNSRPTLEQNALMVSDSFGTTGASVFAAAFRRLLHAGTNDIGEGDTRLVELIGRLQAVAPVDRLIFLVHDGNLDTIKDYGRILGKASLASHD